MKKLTITAYTAKGGEYVRQEKEIEAEFMGRKRVLYLGIDIEGDDRRKEAGS